MSVFQSASVKTQNYTYQYNNRSRGKFTLLRTTRIFIFCSF